MSIKDIDNQIRFKKQDIEANFRKNERIQKSIDALEAKKLALSDFSDRLPNVTFTSYNHKEGVSNDPNFKPSSISIASNSYYGLQALFYTLDKTSSIKIFSKHKAIDVLNHKYDYYPRGTSASNKTIVDITVEDYNKLPFDLDYLKSKYLSKCESKIKQFILEKFKSKYYTVKINANSYNFDKYQKYLETLNNFQ